MDTSELTPLPVELRTRAGLAATTDGHALSVRDRDGRLLLELREDGTIVLCVQHGDLVLASEHGRVRVEGGAGVSISAPQVTVETPHLRHVVGILETHARRILEKARDTYRDVEGTSQVRASQVRIVAQRTLRAVAERVRMRASQDAKVQAEKIYLG